MQARQTPTSPSAKAAKNTEVVAKVWANAELQQPLRIPWGGIISLAVLASLVVGLLLIVGLGLAVHRFPNSWLTRFMPLTTTSTTTVVQSAKDITNGAVPTAVVNIQTGALAIAQNLGQNGVYAAADTGGYAWPLSSGGWMLSISGAWPTAVKSLVAVPTVGQPLAVSSNLTDPATPFVFLKTTDLTASPISLAPTENIHSGLQVWVVTMDSIAARQLSQSHTPHWTAADRLETTWTLDAPVTVPLGAAVVDSDGRLVGLIGTESRVWPATTLSNAIKTVVQSGTLERPQAGFSALNLALAAVSGNPSAKGWLVGAPDGQKAVIAKQPAEKAGLQSGDTITAVDGQLPTADTFFEVLTKYHVGDTVKLDILRIGAAKSLNLKLGALGS